MRSTHQSWRGGAEPQWSGLPGWACACEGQWKGFQMSLCPVVHLTPASLNHWTSQERWPPPSSNRSSVSFSLCSQEEKKLWGVRVRKWNIILGALDKCIIMFTTFLVYGILACIIMNYATTPSSALSAHTVHINSHDLRLARDLFLSRGCVRWLGP